MILVINYLKGGEKIMKKYMLLYLSPISAEDQMKMSPEEAKKGTDAWMAWFKKSGSAIVDGGTPLGMSMNVTPTAISKGLTKVSGYSIVQADSVEGVKMMLMDNPFFMMPDTSIEVLEVMPVAM